MNSLVFLITLSLLFMLFLVVNTSEEEKWRNIISSRPDQVGWSDIIDALSYWSKEKSLVELVSLMGNLLTSFPESISSSVLLNGSTVSSSYCTANAGRNKRCSFIEAINNELDPSSIEPLEISEAPKSVDYFAQVKIKFLDNCWEIASSKQEAQAMIINGLSMTVFGLIPPNQSAFIKRIKSSIVLNSTCLFTDCMFIKEIAKSYLQQ